MPKEFHSNVHQYTDGGYPEKNKPSIGGHDMPPGKHKLLGKQGRLAGKGDLYGEQGNDSGPRTVSGPSFAAGGRAGGPGGQPANAGGLVKQMTRANALRRLGRPQPTGDAIS